MASRIRSRRDYSLKFFLVASGAVFLVAMADKKIALLLSVFLIVVFLVISYQVGKLGERTNSQNRKKSNKPKELRKSFYTSDLDICSTKADEIPDEQFRKSENIHQILDEFDQFEFIINRLESELSGEFKLVELATNQLEDQAFPAHGRSYAIYHGKLSVGRLALQPDSSSNKGSGVLAKLKLDQVVPHHYESLRSFLNLIADFVASSESEAEKEKIHILSTLQGAVWNWDRTGNAVNSDGALPTEIHFRGTALLYKKWLSDHASTTSK